MEKAETFKIKQIQDKTLILSIFLMAFDRNDVKDSLWKLSKKSRNYLKYYYTFLM